MASKSDLGIHVRLTEVSARYSDEAVGPVSFELDAHEFVSLIGPGNCGKSLLLRLIAGLREPDSGRLDLGSRRSPGRKDVGFVFRDPVLFPWRNVLDNVILEAEICGLDRRASEQRARHLLAAMSLTGVEDRWPADLRFEEAQRAAICRALLHDPVLLLMDDPFGRLDFATREHLVSDLQRLWMESRFAAVLATGDISEAVQLSDRIVLLSPRPGRILQIVAIDLPRPRRLDKATTPQIAEYCSRIRMVFRAQGLPY